MEDCPERDLTRQTGSPLSMNVVLLSLSYMSEGYLLFMFIFWLYIYLVEVREFTLAQGGWRRVCPG